MPASAETSVTGTGHDTRSSVESSLASGEGDIVGDALADALEEGHALADAVAPGDNDALGEPEALADPVALGETDVLVDPVADGEAKAEVSVASGVALGAVGSATGRIALRVLDVTVGDGDGDGDRSTVPAEADEAVGDADAPGGTATSGVAVEDPTGLAGADADALANGSRRAVGSHRPGSTAIVVISPPKESAWAKLPHGISAATRAIMTLAVAAFPSIRGSARDRRRLSRRRNPLPRDATSTPSLCVTAICIVGVAF